MTLSWTQSGKGLSQTNVQPAFTCSTLAIKTPEKHVKYVQS